MNTRARSSIADIIEYLRRVAALLHDPFDIKRNNLVIGQRLRIYPSLRRTINALEAEQYGAGLPEARALALQGLQRLAASRPFPEGSLGHCYRKWMQLHGFDATGIVDSVQTIVDAGFPIVAFYNAYGHDLAHVLTGIGVDMYEEYLLQGVLNGTPFPTFNNVFYRRMLPLSVVWSARFGGLGSIRPSYRAFHAGESIAARQGVGGIASPLTVPHLHRPLAAVREQFNISPQWLALAAEVKPQRALPAASVAA